MIWTGRRRAPYLPKFALDLRRPHRVVYRRRGIALAAARGDRRVATTGPLTVTIYAAEKHEKEHEGKKYVSVTLRRLGTQRAKERFVSSPRMNRALKRTLRNHKRAQRRAQKRAS